MILHVQNYSLLGLVEAQSVHMKCFDIVTQNFQIVRAILRLRLGPSVCCLGLASSYPDSIILFHLDFECHHCGIHLPKIVWLWATILLARDQVAPS